MKIKVQNNNFRLSTNRGFQSTFKEHHFKLYLDKFENQVIILFSSLKMQIKILKALEQKKLQIRY